MIVVRKEDRPKIIALVVLLVLVVGFVIKTVLGTLSSNSAPPVVAAPPPAPAPAPAGAPSTNPAPTGPVVMSYSVLPAPNETDPFRAVLSLPGANPPPAPIKASKDVSPMPQPIGGGIRPFKPGEGGGPTVSLEPKTITLNGIVSGRSLAALVSVGDETQLLGVGKEIDGFYLAQLTGSQAVFTTRKARLVLKVGDSASAPTG